MNKVMKFTEILEEGKREWSTSIFGRILANTFLKLMNYAKSKLKKLCETQVA